MNLFFTQGTRVHKALGLGAAKTISKQPRAVLNLTYGTIPYGGGGYDAMPQRRTTLEGCGC